MRKKILVIILVLLILLLIGISVVYYMLTHTNLFDEKNDDKSKTEAWELYKIEILENDGKIIQISDNSFSIIINESNIEICSSESSNCELVNYKKEDNLITIEDGNEIHFAGTYNIIYSDDDIKLERKLEEGEKITYYFTSLRG